MKKPLKTDPLAFRIEMDREDIAALLARIRDALKTQETRLRELFPEMSYQKTFHPLPFRR